MHLPHRLASLPRVLGLLALGMLALGDGTTGASAAPLATVTRSDDDLLVFELSLGEHLLSQGLFAYRLSPHNEATAEHSGVLLPLGEMVRLLELPVRVDAPAGTASGRLSEPGDGFHLDLAQGRATVAGQTVAVARGQAEIHADDLYIDATLLARWLAVDFAIDLAALELRITSRRTLPLEQRLARETRWRRFGGSGSTHRSGPRFAPRETPYRLVDWPVLDARLDLALERRDNGMEVTTARHSMLAQGDFLAMTADLFLSGNHGRGVEDPLADARLTLGRRDPEGGLLGPLRATDVRFGDLTSPSDPLISRGHPGRGFELVRATAQGHGAGPRAFDRTTLRGDALPGWDLELYRNGVLHSFTTIGDDGRYELTDVPLLFGENVLRLVFYGPYGEVREKVERVFIGAGLLPPGDTDYRFGIYQQDVGLFQRGRGLSGSDAEAQGQARLTAGIARGLTRRLSIDAGLESLALRDGRHDYVHAGLRASFFGAAGRLSVLHDSAGGTAAKLALQRRLGPFTLVAEHTRLDGFVSEEIIAPDLRSRSEARLDGQLRLPRVGIVPVGVTLRRERRAEGASFELRAATGFTLPLRRLSVTNRWRLDVIGSDLDDGALAVRGNVLINGWLQNVLLRGNLSYDLAPEPGLASVDVIGRWRPHQRLGTTFGLQHSLDQGITQVSAGADWRLRSVRVGLALGWGTDGSLRTSASLSFSLGRDPRSGHPRLRAEPAARQGAVSARAFLDHNVNGRLDPGDEALEGVRFAVNGGRHEIAAGADGVAHLALSPFRHADLSVDEQSLEDPFWVPQVDGLGFVPRPGVVWTAEFPVVVTGEIDGTVTLRHDQDQRVLSGVRLELVAMGGEVVQQVMSQFDGFYLFERVPPGRYALRIDPEQAEGRHLRLPSPVTLRLASGEVRTIDLALERAATPAAGDVSP